MCTVTFLPGGDGIYHLTSNRDVHGSRVGALPPQSYGELHYPLDPQGGGTWIALRRGDAAVLLNGAFEPHRKLPSYVKSRGRVLLDIMWREEPLQRLKGCDLSLVEPFTLILFLSGSLFESRWDGTVLHTKLLDAERPHIWSSVTLYDGAIIRKREAELINWYRYDRISHEEIMEFHRRHRRTGEISTVSITTIRLEKGRGDMRYYDIRRTGAARWPPAFLIRLRSWEYWPFPIVYAPIFCYWIWLSIKARSLFFFNAANPTIENAGFLLESKKAIYDLMPAELYPGTLYCRKNVPVKLMLREMAGAGMVFPLIAKPDIGQRGMGVALIRNEGELILYSARTKVDFLLQEFIDRPLEAGIFYYRLPGEKKGKVSGIVGKEMMTVTGDGYSTIEMLLCREDRYLLQLPALARMHGDVLQMILPPGKVFELAPFGNHSRGARFIDERHRITPELEQAIDDICQRIPGFYFGRMDIKFDSWQELEAGRHFSIIELNGAGSEPTHIYDPAHSIFFAWKEIIRHLDILLAVSQGNKRQCGIKPMSLLQGIRMFRDYSRYEKLIS